MSTKDHDTDPSTPGAKQRVSDPRTVVAIPNDGEPPPSIETPSLRPSTNPGVGPPPEPRPAPAHPMGIVVPPPSVPPRKSNDSVDLLLDGIPEEQLDRARTMPQTDGQASAVYHAQHGVRSAQTSVADEPKVVVERPELVPTVRVRRANLPKEHPAAPPKVASLIGTEEVTVISGPPMRSRLVMAILAGLLVVFGIFVLLRTTSDSRLAGATTSPASSGAPYKPSPAPAPSGVPVVGSSARTTPAPDLRPSATVAAASAAEPLPPALASAVSAPPSPYLGKPVAPPPRPPKTRTKPAPAPSGLQAPAALPPPAPSSDIGEFKTTF